MSKRTAVGVVKSAKMNKTRVVQIPRMVKHPIYGKFVRQRTTCYVHDEENEANEGDMVEIIESAPRSRQKRWELVRVVERSTAVDLADLKAARQSHSDELDGEE